MKATTLGQLLRYHRKKVPLKQKDLAEAVAYDATVLSRVENDRRLPTPDLLDAITEVLPLTDEERREIYTLYLHTLTQESKPPSDPLPVFDLLRETGLPVQTAVDLTWSQWRNLLAKIGQKRMATGRHKYWPQLYMPRQAVRQSFEAFLQSDRRCFILTGKSGVGKSNFILAMAEELQQSRQEIGVLVYNGAILPTEPTLETIIARDIKKQFKTETEPEGRVWSTLAQIAAQEGRLVLFFIDAINENPQPEALLRQIDRLLKSPWPWLKLVCTSRPETWRQITSRVTLTEALYYQADNKDTSSIKLEPFSPQELPRVYRNYRQVYNLQTDYQQLTNQVRQVLRDPLSLLLVANIYAGRPIPPTLPLASVVDEYLKALVRTERLQAEDLVWLAKEFMPLMLRPDYYSNTVRVDYLEPGDQGAAWTRSLHRLLNADILVREGTGPDQKIAFKYERLYDYFIGHYIQTLTATTSDRLAVYRDFVSHLPGHLYLWGGLQTALMAELRQGQEQQLIEALAGQALPLKEELLTSTLLALSQEGKQVAAGIVENMSKNSQPAVRKTALAIAGRLEFQSVLTQAGPDSDQVVRWTAAYNTYLLWQRQPAAGWSILNTWAEGVGWQFNWPPAGQNLEASLILSTLMLTDPGQDAPELQAISLRLRALWRDMLADLLFIRDAQKDSQIRRVFRRLILLLLDRYFQQWFGQGVPGQVLADFFPLSAEQKSSFLALIDCFELTYEKIRTKEDLLVDVLEWNNLPSVYVVGLLLILKLPRDKDQGLTFVHRLFKRILHPERPIIASGSLTTILYIVVNRGPNPLTDEAFALYRKMTKAHFDRTWGLYYNNKGQLDRHFGLDLFSVVDWHKNHRSRPELLIYALEKTITEQPPHASFILEGLLRDTLQLSHLVGQPRLSVAAIRTILQHESIWQTDSLIRDRIISCMAGIKLYAPDEVEKLVTTYHLPPGMRHLIQVREVNEDLWRRILFPKLALFVGNILPQPEVQGGLIKIIKAIPSCRNSGQWFKVGVKELINMIYGEPII